MKRKSVVRCLLIATLMGVAQSCAMVPGVPTCDGYSKRPINGRAFASVTKKGEVANEGCIAS